MKEQDGEMKVKGRQFKVDIPLNSEFRSEAKKQIVAANAAFSVGNSWAFARGTPN